MSQTHHKPVNGLVGRLLLTTGLAIAGILGFMATTADADPGCDTRPYADETEFADACKENFLYDPGQEQLIVDTDLTIPVVEFYESIDFDRRWVWYAPYRTGQTILSQSTEWAYCNDVADGRQAGELCTAIPVIHTTMDSTFVGTDPVALSLISDGQSFIARACGNTSKVKPDIPSVFVEGFKYHDVDRDMTHDGIATEPGLEGWTFDIVRDVSYVGETTGLTSLGIVHSDASGRIRFEATSDELKLGPGEYRLVERVQAGWTPTDGDSLSFTLNFGDAGEVIDAGKIGNARSKVDVAKVEFEAADDFPAEIEARVATVLPIDVTLANLGPAQQVKVRDRVVVSGPSDCVIDDSNQVIETVLRKGDPPKTFRFEFVVRCDNPSFHDFVFDDTLTVLSADVVDVNQDNNTAQLPKTIPVTAETDFSIEADIQCPDRTDVDTDTPCSVTLDVDNQGFGPVEGRIEWTVTSPSDCTTGPADGSELVTLDSGEGTTINAVHTINCANRSYHPINVTATVAPVDIHVFDIDDSNDTSGDESVIEVFESADLSVVELDLWLTCDEYFAGDPFTCSAVVPITNLGPAPDVVMLTTASLAGETCTTFPDPQAASRLVDVGETVTVDFTWTVSCEDPSITHVLYLDACVENDPTDPHAEDRNPDNDCGRVAAVPIDFKPLSDPNTVNLMRKGVTSVAILSSPLFDPMAEVDTSRPITFGPTGTEATATSCATEGEDANRDGHDQDLTCKFRNQDLGLDVGDDRVYLIGYLVDGTRFIGTEQVRVV